MTLTSSHLFLAISISGDFLTTLKKSPFYSQFLDKSPTELKLIEQNDALYLGKDLGEEIDVEHLKLVEANLLSLLKKLSPEQTIDSNSLILFPTFYTPLGI